MKSSTIILLAILFIIMGITLGIHSTVLADQSIPNWIKNTAKLWGEGQTSDSEFINAIQWLIDQKILATQSKSESTKSQLQTITSMQDLLPKQNDMGNEWHSSKILYGKNSYNDSINDNNTLVQQNFTQSNNKDTISIILYHFDSPDKTKKWNDKLVTTFDTFFNGVNKTSQDSSYTNGSLVDDSIQDMCQLKNDPEINPQMYYSSVMLCHHENFQITVMGHNYPNSNMNMNRFAEIVLNKIWLVVNVSGSR